MRALAAGVITQSLFLYHPGILEGRAVTATAYRDADGMVLAAYGPSHLQVVCMTDEPHTSSCSLTHVLPDCTQVSGLTGECTGCNGLFVCMGPELSSNACQGSCE